MSCVSSACQPRLYRIEQAVQTSSCRRYESQRRRPQEAYPVLLHHLPDTASIVGVSAASKGVRLARSGMWMSAKPSIRTNAMRSRVACAVIPFWSCDIAMMKRNNGAAYASCWCRRHAEWITFARCVRCSSAERYPTRQPQRLTPTTACTMRCRWSH